MSDVVKVSDSGHVRTIVLNRPQKKNALSNALAWGVAALYSGAIAGQHWRQPMRTILSLVVVAVMALLYPAAPASRKTLAAT